MTENGLRLWLDGREADMDASTVIAFNYALEDLTAPGVVRNSWSYTATLPPTAGNHDIFSRAYDPAMTTDHGVRRDFVLMDARGGVVERGYFKLAQATTGADGVCTGYEVNFFGELGAMLYALSTDEETGESLTLSDLKWDAGDLTFAITASEVKTRWSNAAVPGSGNLVNGTFTKYQTLNFAVCYEGTDAAGDGFDADKVYMQSLPSAWTRTVTEDGTTYTTDDGGGAVLTMPQELNGFDMHDLRSYLQRPVISVGAFLSAVRNTLGGLGYTLTFSDAVSTLPSLLRGYITLPLMTQMTDTEGGQETESISGTLTLQQTMYSAEWGETMTTSQAISFNTTPPVTAYVTVAVEDLPCMFAVAGGLTFRTTVLGYNREMAVGLMLEAQDSSGLTVDSFKVAVTADADSARDIATMIYSGMGSDTELLVAEIGGEQGGFTFPIGGRTLEGVGITRVKATLWLFTLSLETADDRTTTWNGGRALLVSGEWAEFTRFNFGEGAVFKVTTDSTTTVGSGTTVTPTMLFGSLGWTPASLLVDIVKIWGLALKQTGAKSFSLMGRDEMYSTAGPVDITAYIDTGQGVQIAPRVYESRFVTMEGEEPEGAYAERYKARQGVPWGRQALNTGYYFDDGAENVWDGVGVRFAPSVMPRDNFQYRVTEGTTVVPVGLYLGGCTYALVSEDGDEHEVSPKVSTLKATAFNPAYEGYAHGGWIIPQFCDSDGGSVDGSGVLLFLGGTISNLADGTFFITDDSSAMARRNAGNRCWTNTGTGLTLTAYALFNSVNTGIGFACGGVPAEFEAPGSAVAEKSFYTERWKAYLVDRCDARQRVATVKGRLDTLIGRGSAGLGRFVWWRRRIWVVNRISNYDVSGKTLATYELISVGDTKNYTAGQNNW